MTWISGSSPRVRGTDFGSGPNVEPGRFIPACAGNRPFSSAVWRFWAVHPRVCGEQQPSRWRRNRIGGSSPRVRGTGFIAYGVGNKYRFIPACAGNRQFHDFHTSLPTVHPRVCGEQFSLSSFTGIFVGSSPRVRGTVFRRQIWRLVRRFIPACAGNSSQYYVPRGCSAVHPRVCGEQSAPRPSRRLPDGSSPRVRGTGISSQTDSFPRRFIPACAGEQLSITASRTSVFGSSPRVRGTVNTRLRGYRW